MLMSVAHAESVMDIRNNADLAKLHANAAELLHRIADGDGSVSRRDMAMARIYATQLERRRRVTLRSRSS